MKTEGKRERNRMCEGTERENTAFNAEELKV